MDQTALRNEDSRGLGKFEAVHARILRFFPDVVQELGAEPERLMRQVGISRENFPEDASRATYRQMVRLIELAAVQLNCPDFGMRLAARQSGSGMFGPLGQVMKHSRTFGEALDYVAKHAYAHSLAARIWLRQSSSPKGILAGHDILLDRVPSKSQAMEQILLAGHLAAVEITGGRARVRQVHFRHQPVSSLKTYRRYFGCTVRFGQHEDGVFFSERDLACPIIDPDSRLYRAAISFIDASFTQRRPPLQAQARGMIMQRLGTEECSNERIAAALNLHPRTLHRRLRAAGTSFQQIKDEVRRDIMLYYLRETRLDFALISERLGFAEQSIMTRLCNRWFCASPTKLRSQALRDALER
ncbi:MAG TPA: AraC family transcriptional regulator ligand-binding domain-containing protein [Steroidobacteraceae bacterium]|nr:AraC family transcriptional regulator ligand-binding domain-containing protein [Steroidobacteraceae bacterium]